MPIGCAYPTPPPRKGTLLPASPPGIGRRSAVRSKSKSKSKSGSGSGSIPALVGTRLSFTAQTSPPSRSPLPLALLASWRLNSPAFTHPTDGIESGADSSTGKGRPHQMNRQDAKDAKEIESLEKVVIGASIGYELQELGPPEKARSFLHRLQALVADQSDRNRNRNRNRNRDRDRSPPWLAPGLSLPPKLHCRVVPSLALLASWRLNSPAFTHPTDGIESKWTFHPARADPIR